MRPSQWIPLVALALVFGKNGPASADHADISIDYADPYSRTLFFAILEGLYEDGVQNEVDDSILATDPAGGGYLHFVPACPLCTPTLKAFQLYRRRPDLGLKSGKDTFGEGLPDEVAAKILRGKPEERLAALNRLVETWLSRKLASLRLSAEERAAWSAAFEDGRKRGMAAYFVQTRQAGAQAGFKLGYVGEKTCAVCDGANQACAVRR